MKFAEMNKHEQAAFMLVKEEYNEYVGGLENTLLDYDEDSDEYKTAKHVLDTPDIIADTVYWLVMNYASRNEWQQHIKFAGKDFIKERIEKRLIKDGYRKGE